MSHISMQAGIAGVTVFHKKEAQNSIWRHSYNESTEICCRLTKTRRKLCGIRDQLQKIPDTEHYLNIHVV
jgi:hypothetical protein